MEKQIEIPLFETTLTKFNKTLVFVQIGIGIFGIVWLAFHLTKTDWAIQFFIFLLLFLWIIQIIRVAKTFQLYTDRLVVKRSFFFNDKTDVTFKIIELKEIIFRRIKGKFGGPHIIIKTKRFNESYRIDIKSEILEDFMSQLTTLGVKVSSEDM